jgi:hypothetical protein
MTTLLPFDLPLECRRRISLTKPTQVDIRSAQPLNRWLRGKSVVLCDCDSRWSLSRLHSMIVGYLQGRLKQAPFKHLGHASTYELRPSLERVAEGILRHVYMYFALPPPLHSLPPFVACRATTQEGWETRIISMLIIDPINPLYWHDRWVVEVG